MKELAIMALLGGGDITACHEIFISKGQVSIVDEICELHAPGPAHCWLIDSNMPAYSVNIDFGEQSGEIIVLINGIPHEFCTQ